jgi:hypothetical protein
MYVCIRQLHKVKGVVLKPLIAIELTALCQLLSSSPPMGASFWQKIGRVAC